MHKVYIPIRSKTSGEQYYIASLLQAFYETSVEFTTKELSGQNTLVMVVSTNKTMGKAPLVRFLYLQGEDVMYFEKAEVLYMKYLDTGIVERISL